MPKKKIYWIALVPVLGVAAYLGLWPVPITPLAWQAPAAPGYVGIHQANTRLQGARTIDLNGEAGPEHVAVGPDGMLYMGVTSGRVLRMRPDGSGQQVFAITGGRPLGIAFDAAGKLIVADAIKGLLSIGTDGRVDLLADRAANAALRFVDAVVIASNGKIYFSDASMRFGPAQWGSTLEAAMLDIFEQSSTGRVLEYDPSSKIVRIVVSGLSFANGLALSADESSLFVSESGKYRVWKFAVTADRLDVAQPSAQATVVLDNLPGYPDNLMRGLDGKLWLGLAGPRNELDAMAQRPFLRQLALRIPRAFWSKPKPYGHVMAFAENGTVLADLQDPGGSSPLTTGVTETAGRLYIHNADGKGLGWLPR